MNPELASIHDEVLRGTVGCVRVPRAVLATDVV